MTHPPQPENTAQNGDNVKSPDPAPGKTVPIAKVGGTFEETTGQLAVSNPLAGSASSSDTTKGDTSAADKAISDAREQIQQQEEFQSEAGTPTAPSAPGDWVAPTGDTGSESGGGGTGGAGDGGGGRLDDTGIEEVV